MAWASFLCAKYSSVSDISRFLNNNLCDLKLRLFNANIGKDKLLFKGFNV
jgi:hypothetical protein